MSWFLGPPSLQRTVRWAPGPPSVRAPCRAAGGTAPAPGRGVL